MSLTEKDIKKVATLARLKDNSVNAEDLSNILKLVEQMSLVNTDNVKPMAHPFDVPQPLREDTVTESNERDNLQKIAPAVESGLYLVPEVIEQREKADA